METTLQPLERFQIGQCCMIAGELTRSWLKHRLYVTVAKVGKHRVTLIDSCGNKYIKTPRQIAIFIQPPSNWNELYQQGELINYLTPVIG